MDVHHTIPSRTEESTTCRVWIKMKPGECELMWSPGESANWCCLFLWCVCVDDALTSGTSLRSLMMSLMSLMSLDVSLMSLMSLMSFLSLSDANPNFHKNIPCHIFVSQTMCGVLFLKKIWSIFRAKFVISTPVSSKIWDKHPYCDKNFENVFLFALTKIFLKKHRCCP